MKHHRLSTMRRFEIKYMELRVSREGGRAHYYRVEESEYRSIVMIML